MPFVIAAAVLAAAVGCASDPRPVPRPPWLEPTPPRTSPKDPSNTDPEPAAGKTTVIEASGEGITKEAAKKDALRNALERGAGMVIRNQSLAVDWQLARDVVLTETRGSVVKFDVLSMKKAGGVFRAKVRAVVSTELIAKDLSILHYLSNHARIACAIVDFAGGKPAETALAQSSFERRLLAKQFNLVSRSQVERIKARDRLDSFKDAALARKLGERWGCDILITGKGYTNFAKAEKVYGVEQLFYTASIEAKAVLVSSGAVIASDNVTVRRGGRSAAAAEKLALSGAGDEIADRLIRKIVLHLRKSSLDENSIEILVKGVTFEQLIELEKVLRKLKGMQKVVQRSYRDGAATLECRFKGDARTLALLIAKLDKPKLHIASVDRNRIEVKPK